MEALPIEHVAAALGEAYKGQMGLCDLLEAIADSLPSRVNRQQCLFVARMIAPILQRAHLAEEAHLFPRIIGRTDGSDLVERLRMEHIEDECFADEVQLELLQLGRGEPVLGPEATGYMLRGFFEGIRRHCRFDIELLATLAARA